MFSQTYREGLSGAALLLQLTTQRMEIFKEIIGNLHSSEWRERSATSQVEYIDLEEWQAQRSRFLARSESGEEYAIALRRHTPIKDGDILYAEAGRIVAIRLKLSQIMTLDLSDITLLTPTEIISLAVEIGHALGNQHWPAVVQGSKVFVPLTVDRKVMQSVMKTHSLEHIAYSFRPADQIIPYLSPHEVRRLMGAAHHTEHSHVHK